MVWLDGCLTFSPGVEATHSGDAYNCSAAPLGQRALGRDAGEAGSRGRAGGQAQALLLRHSSLPGAS